MENRGVIEFESFEEITQYLKEKAADKIKIKMYLARHNKLDTSKETLVSLYKISLKEAKEEMLEDFRNGLIIFKNQEEMKKILKNLNA